MLEAAEALDSFIRDAPARIARLRGKHITNAAPKAFRAASLSVGEQASGDWTAKVVEGKNFSIVSPMREFCVGTDFGAQCAYLVREILKSANPELKVIINKFESQKVACDAILSAFFHYFIAHEFLHFGQRLGSDQYKDSDHYMPIVMAADYEADIVGLLVAVNANIPELSDLSKYEKALLLIAIHIFSMQSFTDLSSEMDIYTFYRLILWYLHFSRINKAGFIPDFSSPTISRSWVITLPRLIGTTDYLISEAGLAARAAQPYPAHSDIVVAYHHDDGMYRIHRAALTDSDRILRLSQAIVGGRFDEVRVEFEEVLVNNPALLPNNAPNASSVEWAAGDVIEELEQISIAMADGVDLLTIKVSSLQSAIFGLRTAIRASGRFRGAIPKLAKDLDNLMADLAFSLKDSTHKPVPATLCRKMISIVDQIVVFSNQQPVTTLGSYLLKLLKR